MLISKASELLTRRVPFAIVRADDLADASRIASALLAGGIRQIEFSLTNSKALDAIADTRAKLGSYVAVGAGTVLTAADATASIKVGAEFLVTPIVAADVLDVANCHGIPVICGAATPTEMVEATRLGAAYVKLFPAGHLPPSYVKDVLAPLPWLKIVCVGGISAANAAAYLDAGAYTVGLGSTLVDNGAIERGDWLSITDSAKRAVAACLQPNRTVSPGS